MQQIVNFLIRYKNTLFFLILFAIAIIFTVQSHTYHRSKFISSANFLTGGIYSWSSNINDYFYLKNYNERLLGENKSLRAQLSRLTSQKVDSIFEDSTSFNTPYRYTKARVIANRFAGIDNYILIDRGKQDSVVNESGVITSKGIVGIVEKTSAHFSRVISILNTNTAINVQLKKSDHFGTLIWNGKDPNIVQFTEIPRLASVKKGDTVITNGRSLIFPKGVPVGLVKDFKLDESQNFYNINVRLFNDMTNIGYVYVIENKEKEELKKLEQSDEQ